MLSRTLVFALAGGLLIAVACSEPDATAPPEAFTAAPALNLTTPIYPEGMISYWKFGEPDGAVVLDAVADNDGTIHNALRTTGQVDGALYFDRTPNTNYVEVPDDAALNMSDELSIEAWVYWEDPISLHSDYAIVVKETGYCKYGYRLSLLNGSLNLMVHDGIGYVQHGWCGTHELRITMESGNYLPRNSWHHVAGVYSNLNDFAALYMDGVLLKRNDSFTAPLDNSGNTHPLTIGAWMGDPADGWQSHETHVWEGMIDEVAIYDRVLTPEEIEQHYLAGLSGHGYELSVIPVEIDIKPGSDPNSINCYNQEEVITVAILTTDAFDATTVDHTTVTFEGATETHVNKKDYEARRHEEDVDGDGDTDLVLHFRRGDATGLTCESTQATLTGQTYDEVPIEGTDDVRMIG